VAQYGKTAFSAQEQQSDLLLVLNKKLNTTSYAGF